MDHDDQQGVRKSLYGRWLKMRRRCLYPLDPRYKDYGGRGIFVCERWLKSFENFYLDMGPPPTRKHQIDRINNDGPYSPENCRWATTLEQARNRRQNIRVTHNGLTLCLMDWQHKTGIRWNTIRERLSRGWDADRALTTPARKKQKTLPPITWNGQTKTVTEWSIALGGSPRALAGRLINGWPLERAMTEPFGFSSIIKRRTT